MKRSIYDKNTFEKFLIKNNCGTKDIRRIRRLLFREFLPVEMVIQNEILLKNINDNFHSSFLDISEIHDSKIDGATKILFKTHDGHHIETVILRIESGRTSVCISSQIGCNEKCTFCATGKIGFIRNLSHDEIIDQIVHVGKILKKEEKELRNIVFMGMGEAFHNFDNLVQVINTLTDGATFQFAHKFITVSTLGLADRLEEFSTLFPSISIAISLNAPDDLLRESIMPVNRRFPLESLKKSIMKIQENRKNPVMIEYIMFRGLNDSKNHAAKLSDFLKDLNVHINLIPYNSLDKEERFQSSDNETIDRFRNILLKNGFKVTRRISLGQDITAACGQLAGKNKEK